MLHLVANDDTDMAAILSDLGGVTTLVRDPGCFMQGVSPQRAAVETAEPDRLVAVAEALGDRVDRARSMAIVGTDVAFITPPQPAPVRYQYLMHRRADFTHEQYLERYRVVHSDFGLRTPNISGYVQLHVDLDASRDLGTATGLRADPCDSMSELHLRSVDHFLAGIAAHPEVGAAAQEDEERFVDRPRSFGFTHRVV